MMVKVKVVRKVGLSASGVGQVGELQGDGAGPTVWQVGFVDDSVCVRVTGYERCSLKISGCG